LKDKARQCKVLATTCDRSKRSTALIQSVNTGFGALLVFLICCAPGDTDGAHRLGVASDRKTSWASDDRQAGSDHAPHRLEIQNGTFIAVEAAAAIAFPIASGIDSEKTPSIRWKATRRPSSSQMLTAIFIFIAVAPGNCGGDRLIGYGQSKHGKLVLSLHNVHGSPLILQYSPSMRTSRLGGDPYRWFKADYDPGVL
jgi:hypothetical protein